MVIKEPEMTRLGEKMDVGKDRNKDTRGIKDIAKVSGLSHLLTLGRSWFDRKNYKLFWTY